MTLSIADSHDKCVCSWVGGVGGVLEGWWVHYTNIIASYLYLGEAGSHRPADFYDFITSGN